MTQRGHRRQFARLRLYHLYALAAATLIFHGMPLALSLGSLFCHLSTASINDQEPVVLAIKTCARSRSFHK
jgi:hypothetical protein